MYNIHGRLEIEYLDRLSNTIKLITDEDRIKYRKSTNPIVKYIIGYKKEYIESEIKFFKGLVMRYNHMFVEGKYRICEKILNFMIMERLYYLLNYATMPFLDVCDDCDIIKKKSRFHFKFLGLLYSYSYCKCSKL